MVLALIQTADCTDIVNGLDLRSFLHVKPLAGKAILLLYCNLANGYGSRELRHAMFLSHGWTPEVYCFAILLVFTLPHLHF